MCIGLQVLSCFQTIPCYLRIVSTTLFIGGSLEDHLGFRFFDSDCD